MNKKFELVYPHITLKFDTAIEALNQHLHVPGFTNQIFADIVAKAPMTTQEFTKWVKDTIQLRFASNVTIGGIPIKKESDNEMEVLVRYFCETVQYNPEKVLMMLNKHNPTFLRSLKDDVGIATMMIFHAMKQ